jgi:hypothetical protein
MIRKILESCPSCGGSLEIGEVHCTVCETQVHARYRPCDFCMLTEEQSTFLLLFVTSRGNLSEVEKRLGVSYPTVRAKLDEIIERLSATESGALAPGGSAAFPRRRSGLASPPEPTASADPNDELPPLPGTSKERRQILEAVKRGELSTAEGLDKLRALGAGHEEG